MDDVSSDAVEADLRRLDGEALAAFVADLWSARGYETRREDGVVVATRDAQSTVIAPVAHTRLRSPSLPDRPVDVVVAPAGAEAVTLPEGVRVVDAADLREMLWYALDAETSRQVRLRHFGASTPTASAPWPDRVAGRLRALRDRLSSVSLGPVRALALVGVLAFLVAFGAVAGGPPGRAPTDEVTGTGVPTSAATPAAIPSETATGTPTWAMPPGVARDGVTNLTALAAAHDARLANRSYTIWVDRYRPRSPGRERRQRDIDVAVAGDRYLVETTLETDGERSELGAVYYDGRDWYVRNESGRFARYRRVPGTAAPPVRDDPFDLRRSLVSRYLSTPETTLSGSVRADGRRLYRVIGNGMPTAAALAGVENYTVTALVDRNGVVHDLEAEYHVPTANGSVPVRFEVAYDRFGGTVVVAPDWYDRRFGSG